MATGCFTVAHGHSLHQFARGSGENLAFWLGCVKSALFALANYLVDLLSFEPFADICADALVILEALGFETDHG